MLLFFPVAYEFLSADYKIWNTNGEALFAFPPPKVTQWLGHNTFCFENFTYELQLSQFIEKHSFTGTNLYIKWSLHYKIIVKHKK